MDIPVSVGKHDGTYAIVVAIRDETCMYLVTRNSISFSVVSIVINERTFVYLAVRVSVHALTILNAIDVHSNKYIAIVELPGTRAIET